MRAPQVETHGLRASKPGIAVWQWFWEHHIRDARDFEADARWCWGNAVKYGFMERARDWPYASGNRRIWLGRVEAEWAGWVMEGEFGE